MAEVRHINVLIVKCWSMFVSFRVNGCSNRYGKVYKDTKKYYISTPLSPTFYVHAKCLIADNLTVSVRLL